jgi:hypothetical protein
MRMGRYNSDSETDFLEKIKTLEDRISKLERTPQAGNSGMSRGSFTVEGGGDIIVRDGGAVRALNDDGSEASMEDGRFKTISGDVSGDEEPGAIFGFVLEQSNDPGFSGRMVMFLVPPYDPTVGIDDDNLMYLEGESSGSPGSFYIQSKTTDPVGAGWIVAANLLFMGQQQIFLNAQAGNVFINASGDVLINPSSLNTFVTYQNTASAANCNLAVNGLIQRSTSSVRNKVDVEDLDIDTEAVLQLRPRTWRDKKEAESAPEGETTRRYVGLVAEEVAEHLPAFVEYDENGDPDYVSYDRLAVALLAVVQELSQQVQELAELNDLTLGRRARSGIVVGSQPPPTVPSRPEPTPMDPPTRPSREEIIRVLEERRGGGRRASR